jgi:hypothetical protein
VASLHSTQGKTGIRLHLALLYNLHKHNSELSKLLVGTVIEDTGSKMEWQPFFTRYALVTPPERINTVSMHYPPKKPTWQSIRI